MQVMTENRVVPQLRFKEFQNELKVSLIKNLTKVYDGTHSTPKYVDNGIPFYSVEHISSDDFTKTKYISEEVFEKENKRVKLERGDILMTRIGSVGVAKLIDWEVNASFYVSLALFKNNPSFHSPFLAFYINSISCQKEIWKRTIHVAFPKKINLGEISNCKVVLPSLTEQQKIASFLSAVDEKLQQLTKKKELLEEYKKGVMQKIFSKELRFKDEFGNNYPDWEEKKLGEIGEFKTSSVDKLIKEDEKMVSLVNYMNVYNHQNITNEITKGLMQVSAKEKQIETSNLKKGDILFTPSSETPSDIGHSIVIFEDLHNTLYSYHLMRFRPIINLDILYSHYFCNIPSVLRQITRFATGSTRFTISVGSFSKLIIQLPSLEEQQKIANFLSSLDSKIELVSTQIENTKAFKKGLLQQMFV